MTKVEKDSLLEMNINLAIDVAIGGEQFGKVKTEDLPRIIFWIFVPFDDPNHIVIECCDYTKIVVRTISKDILQLDVGKDCIRHIITTLIFKRLGLIRKERKNESQSTDSRDEQKSDEHGNTEATG